MTWSTRTLAELADVKLSTIRHYHDVGLLPEPTRRGNGYKQYEPSHLVTVLRIKRLTAMGFSLSQVGKMLKDPEDSAAALQSLDKELGATIARLQRIRSEVAEALTVGAAPDLSPDTFLAMDVLGHDNTGQHTAVLLTHVLSSTEIAHFAHAMSEAPKELTALNTEFSELCPDADPMTVTDLANRIAVSVKRFLDTRPDLMSSGPAVDGLRAGALLDTITDSMSPSQAEVIRGVMARLQNPSSVPSRPVVER